MELQFNSLAILFHVIIGKLLTRVICASDTKQYWVHFGTGQIADTLAGR